MGYKYDKSHTIVIININIGIVIYYILSILWDIMIYFYVDIAGIIYTIHPSDMTYWGLSHSMARGVGSPSQPKHSQKGCLILMGCSLVSRGLLHLDPRF